MEETIKISLLAGNTPGWVGRTDDIPGTRNLSDRSLRQSPPKTAQDFYGFFLSFMSQALRLLHCFHGSDVSPLALLEPPRSCPEAFIEDWLRYAISEMMIVPHVVSNIWPNATVYE
jgi:hypothetical protein